MLPNEHLELILYFVSKHLLTCIEDAEPEENEEPFVAPQGLAIPPDVELVSVIPPIYCCSYPHS